MPSILQYKLLYSGQQISYYLLYHLHQHCCDLFSDILLKFNYNPSANDIYLALEVTLHCKQSQAHTTAVLAGH